MIVPVTFCLPFPDIATLSTFKAGGNTREGMFKILFHAPSIRVGFQTPENMIIWSGRATNVLHVSESSTLIVVGTIKPPSTVILAKTLVIGVSGFSTKKLQIIKSGHEGLVKGQDKGIMRSGGLVKFEVVDGVPVEVELVDNVVGAAVEGGTDVVVGTVVVLGATVVVGTVVVLGATVVVVVVVGTVVVVVGAAVVVCCDDGPHDIVDS